MTRGGEYINLVPIVVLVTLWTYSVYMGQDSRTVSSPGPDSVNQAVDTCPAQDDRNPAKSISPDVISDSQSLWLQPDFSNANYELQRVDHLNGNIVSPAGAERQVPRAFSLTPSGHGPVFASDKREFRSPSNWRFGTNLPMLVMTAVPFNDISPTTPDSKYETVALLPPSQLQASIQPPTISVHCRWDDCRTVISGKSDRLRERMRAHFEDCHDEVLQPSAEKSCLWRGCICHCHRKARCGRRGRDHAAHVRDILTHIWHAHVKST
jgi:hypothetical protein